MRIFFSAILFLLSFQVKSQNSFKNTYKEIPNLQFDIDVTRQFNEWPRFELSTLEYNSFFGKPKSFVFINGKKTSNDGLGILDSIPSIEGLKIDKVYIHGKIELNTNSNCVIVSRHHDSRLEESPLVYLCSLDQDYQLKSAILVMASGIGTGITTNRIVQNVSTGEQNNIIKYVLRDDGFFEIIKN